MALVVINFQAYSPYVGTGTVVPLSFTQGQSPPITLSAHYPPELGCLGIGTTPGSYTQVGVVTDIEARITDRGQQMLARSSVDGTAFNIYTMALGTGGYDPAVPTRALWVNPSSIALGNEVIRRPIDAVEMPGYLGSRAYVCRFDQDSFVGGIGEIGLWAEIVHSDDPSEIGETFLFAVAHQGLNTKTRHHIMTVRVFVTV